MKRISLSLFVVLLFSFFLGSYKFAWGQGFSKSSPKSVRTVAAEFQPTGNGSWTWRGPQYNLLNYEGPLVNVIAIDSNQPDIVYIGTNQGVYRSSNGGESWTVKSSGLGGYGDLVITGIAIDPTNSSRIIISTWGSGIWRSTNNGDNWAKLSNPLSTTMQNGDTIIKTGELPDEITGIGPSITYHEEVGQQQSEGAPVTWQRTAVRQVRLNPDNPSEIFAAVDDGYGLYHSTNNGSSWVQINIGSGSARTFTFAPNNSQIRYASFGSWSNSGGFFRTTNGGTGWTEVGADTINGTVIAVAIHPTNANILFAAAYNDGLYYSSNGGNSWQKVSSGLPDNTFYSVAFAPSNPNIVYAGGVNKAYVSQNGGLNWVVADSSLNAGDLQGLAVHPMQPQTVLFGSNAATWGGVYKRTSIGSYFEFTSTGMENTIVLDIEQDPNDASLIFASTWGAGIFKSTDSGQTWVRNFQIPSYVYDIEAVASDTNLVLYATTFYSDWGIFRSEDRGNSWVEVSRSYPSYISFDIESIYNDPNKLVAATYAGVQYSYDGGATWGTPSGLGTDKGIILRICEFPGTGKLLAATYGGGVFYSSGGQAWYEANVGLLTQSYSGYTYDIACSPDIPGLAYVSGLGVAQTTDYGEHWTPIGGHLSDQYLRSVDIAPGIGDVFIGSTDQGVYFAPQGIPIWEQINNGLQETRIRSVSVIGTSPVKVMVGTNGMGSWEYSLVNRPVISHIFLPTLLNNANSLPTTPICQSYEPNDNLGEAVLLVIPKTYCSYIDTMSDHDYYTFDVRALGPITITLTNIPSGNDYNLEFYDQSQHLMGGSYYDLDHDEQIVFHPPQLGRYYFQVLPITGSNLPQEYQFNLSFNGIRGAASLSGQIYYQQMPISDIPLGLRYENGYRSSRVFSKTDVSGGYQFQKLSSLPIGHSYSIYFLNTFSNNQYLFSWYCYAITEYISGQNQSLCSFDLQDVVALNPSNGSTVQLPVTFTWNQRNISGDSYRVRLRSSNNSAYWLSPVLGDVGAYTLTSLPPGFSLGQGYRWDVIVYTNDGIGYPYYSRDIVFSTTAVPSFNNHPGIVNDINENLLFWEGLE